MLNDTIKNKRIRFGIGITCGASCLGVDAALVRIKGAGPGMHIKLVAHEHTPFPVGLRSRLLTLRKDVHELARLHVKLGEFMADAAQTMKQKAAEELEEADFIAAQGFVASHAPYRMQRPDVGLLHLGDPAYIAETTRLPVVSDFSARDMAAGGQGLPLSGYPDWLLFARDDRTVACLHLGAFGAITLVPPALEYIQCFHTGPCNIAIDGLIQLTHAGNRDRDKDGAMAAKGKVIDEFHETLLGHPFFNRVPPKSTSREEFNPETYLREAIEQRKSAHSVPDLAATVTSAVATSMARAYNRFIRPTHEVSRLILSGGGAKNPTLVGYIRKSIPEATLRHSSEYGLDGMALDPIRIAVLGNETLCGHPSNVPVATGARRAVMLGRITPP